METSETYRQSQALNTLPDEWESLGVTIRIVSARWMLAIIHQLAGGAKRPSYFYKIFPSLSAKTLTVRLRELEEFQLVKREAIYQRRLKVEYELTEKGQELFALVQSLVDFSRSLGSDSTQKSNAPQNKNASDNEYDSAGQGDSDVELEGGTVTPHE
jgi:DNA-binding HxlR family transcriptional regulator